LRARGLARVVLSTEDPEIAEVGRRCGLEVPFLRPLELASEETPALAVAQHALRALEERGERCNAVCLLQPTHPFRRPEDIDGCIELLERGDADAVVTVLPVPAAHNPHWVYSRCEDGCLHLVTGEWSPISRREDLPPAFFREGSVCLTRRDVVLERNSLYGMVLLGYPLEPSRSLDLDNWEDWTRAETLMAGRRMSAAR